MTRYSIVLGLAAFGTAALLAGCPQITSETITTDGLYVDYIVIEEADGTAVAQARFRAGGAAGTGVQLTGGDTVTVNGEPMTLTRAVSTYYEADVDPAETYTFVFTRPDEGGYTSTISPPGSVTITEPAEGAEVSRAEDLTIRWEPDNDAPGNAYNLEVYGPCLDNFVRLAILVTEMTIQANDLAEETDEGGGPDATCTATIRVAAWGEGTMAPGLKGKISAGAASTSTFQTVP